MMNLRTAKKHTKLGKWRSARFAESQRSLARYYATNPHVLRRKIERTERVKFWGCWHTIKPRLVGEVFGDGKLVAISPMNMRPNYWVVRIDSRIGLRSDEWYDLLDEKICVAIEDEFGSTHFECEDCGESDLSDSGCHCQKERWFPALDGDGYSWWEMDWPN